MPAMTDDEFLRFHLTAALKQANTDSTQGNWRGALNNIDRAWNVLDYSKGLVKGLYEFGTDTANGLIDLVTHPIDSAEAIYDSVLNYDKTFDIIKSSLETLWNEYDTYSAEQKGQLHAKITSEILSSILPIGSLKNTAKIAQISKATEQIIGETKKLARIGNYFRAPESLKAFPNLKYSKSKTPVQGGGRLRPRWKDCDGKIYEWDHQHGTIEIYDKRGRHLGEFDSEHGRILKQADPTRKVEP